MQTIFLIGIYVEEKNKNDISTFKLMSPHWGGKGSQQGLLWLRPIICNRSSCCFVDCCLDVRLSCRWLISRSAGYTSLPLINCPINPAAELVMHSLQGCMVQQSDADMCARLADLYSKDSLSICLGILYAKAKHSLAVEGSYSTLIRLELNQYLLKCRLPSLLLFFLFLYCQRAVNH